MQAQCKINLSGEITLVYQTRVNDAGFCDGDQVGIYVVDYNGSTPGPLLDEGNRADNVKLTFDEANFKWNGAYDIYFKDNRTNVDICGYYPSKQHNFTISVNKSAGSGYEFGLSLESIPAWENDAVSHNTTAREYIVIDVVEAGTLCECVEAAGKDVGSVRNLKVTGQITSKDFATMKYLMPRLSVLNLKEIEIVAG